MRTEIQHKIDKINIMLENAMLKLNFMIVSGKAKSLIQLGEGLVSLDSDKYTNGGFWLWDYIANEIFYSPLFCTSLGFEYGELGNGFGGFDRGNAAQLKVEMDQIKNLVETKSLEIFTNFIDFRKKDNTILKVECRGEVLFLNNEPYVILGTRRILEL